MTARLRLTARELRAQLVIIAFVLWAVAIINMWTPTRFLMSGQLKGTDFVQFHTLGGLAAEGRMSSLYDFAAIRAYQAARVPEAADKFYPPVYGPQIPLLFAPLGPLGYEVALATWLGLTAVLYFMSVVFVARSMPSLSAHMTTVVVAAAAFSPFWQLMQHGQLSVLAVVAVVLAWAALRRGHDVGAGLCLGLLAYKPPLFVPVVAVLLLAGAWRTLAASVIVAAAQVAAAMPWVGWEGLYRYGQVLLSLPGQAPLLAVEPSQMHSLRTFWELLVPFRFLSTALYAVSAAAVLVLGSVAWRRLNDPGLRMAVLSLAVVLAAPHLYVYDLTVLAPAFIWLVDWLVRTNPDPRLGRVLYLAYLAPLASPFVPYIRVQISTVALVMLLVAVWRWCGGTSSLFYFKSSA